MLSCSSCFLVGQGWGHFRVNHRTALLVLSINFKDFLSEHETQNLCTSTKDILIFFVPTNSAA